MRSQSRVADPCAQGLGVGQHRFGGSGANSFESEVEQVWFPSSQKWVHSESSAELLRVRIEFKRIRTCVSISGTKSPPPPSARESWMSEWLSSYASMSSAVGPNPTAVSAQPGARGIRAVPTCAILGRWGIHVPHSTLPTRSGIVHGCLSRNTARTAKIRAGYPMAGIRCTQTRNAPQGRREVSPGSQVLDLRLRAIG